MEEKNGEMIYAPVIIPTLNRINHLKRLINSLRANSYAKYTELYISVDYPLKRGHYAGYEQICLFLRQGIEGFKSVNIFFQESNLGPVENTRFLKEKVLHFDRYILTEDDNEFSPNFLEYIDKGLMYYQNEDDIIGICGHAYDFDWEIRKDKLLKIDCAYDGWGIGRWREKDRKIYEELTLTYLENILLDFRRALNLFKCNQYLFCRCVEAVIGKTGDMFDRDGQFHIIDTSLCIYMIDSGKKTINPVLSKVRNWGDDGTGVHYTNQNVGCMQEIDVDKGYSFPEDKNIISGKVVTKKMNRYLHATMVEKICALVKLFVWRRSL